MKKRTIVDAALSVLQSSERPLFASEIAQRTGLPESSMSDALRKRMLPAGLVDRARSAAKGHKWLYAAAGHGFHGVELLREQQRNRKDCQAERRRRAIIARQLRASGQVFGGWGAHRPRPLRPRVDRFPDDRFGPEHRRPLTQAEEQRLVRWANRAS